MNSEQLKKLLKNSSSYWEKRAIKSTINSIENEEDYLKRLKGIYDKASKDIEDKLAVVYTRYAKNNKMTLTEAYKQLPKDMELKYKNDVNEYIRLATEHQGDPKWRQYLLNQSLMHKHSVLNQLQTEYRNVIYDIDMEKTGGKFLEKVFTDTDYYNQYLNNDEEFAHVDKERIQRLIEEDWSGGGSFSDKIWQNKERLIKALDEVVIKGMANGQSFDKMADELAKRMDTSFSNAQRLIMTESARMDNSALLDRYREMGAKKLEFVATLDMKTSEICRAMDGTIINIEDAKIGLNVPPLHPYCRSVIAPVIEPEIDPEGPKSRIYRDPETGKSKKGENITYEEYLRKVLKDEEAAEALAQKKNDLASLVAAINVITPTVTKVSNDTISFTPDKELITKNQESYDDFISRHKDEIDNIEELEENIKKDLNTLLEEGDMATRTTMEALEKILNEGRIKSQFETGKSATYITQEMRKEVEKMLYGYDYDIDAMMRPIYGYVTNLKDGFEYSSKNGAMMYGNVSVILKKSNLINRTTFTVGDSLDGTRFDFKVPNLYTNPTKSALSANRSLTDNYGKYDGRVGTTLDKATESIPYIELQFHGGVKVSDIDKVIIHTSYNTWKGKQYYNIDNAQLSKLEKMLKKAGIDYEVVR